MSINTQSRRRTEPVVWIVDDEQWPRACLRAELIERGFDAYGFITIPDAFGALRRRSSPKPEAIILELRGQNFTPDVLDAIQNLAVPTILLTSSTESTDPLILQRRW